MQPGLGGRVGQSWSSSIDTGTFYLGLRRLKVRAQAMIAWG
jgi:hypothetical protein